MAYRNKVYVAFDGDNDKDKYELIKAWGANSNFDFEFHDAHDINNANDSSQEASIKKQLSERFQNSKLFILLIGKHTKYLTKFVKWEIQTAIRLQLPIICVNLNNSRVRDEYSPSTLDGELAIYVSYKERIIKYAMERWPDSDKQYRRDSITGSYHYPDSVYKDLGL